MAHVAKKSLTGRHLWKRFRMLVVRSPWNIGFALFSLSLALGYVGFPPVLVPPLMFVVGVVLLVLNCYSWVLLVKPLRAFRPPAFVVRAGRMCCLVGFLVWVASVLLAIEVTVTPNERWTLGDACLRREVYRTRVARFAGLPSIQVRLKPTFLPFVIGGPSVGLGHLRDVSSMALEWPIWGLAVSSSLPALVLAHLRRERIRPTHCRECEYDFTGNVSSTCPECGTRT